MNRIVFIIDPSRPSSKHRGTDPAEILKKDGMETCVIRFDDKYPTNASKTTAVFVKRIVIQDVQNLQATGARVVWDAIDVNHTQILNVAKSCNLDGIILNNKEMVFVLSDQNTHPKTKLGYVYHYPFHFDELPKDRKFGILYSGTGGESLLSPEVTVCKYERSIHTDQKALQKYLATMSKFPFHYSVRDRPFKPQTKISNAARCQSNIIINRRAGAVEEMLGDDYPYICEYTKESITKTIKLAKETYGKDLWFYGLEKMKRANEKSTDDIITSQYQKFFKKVEGCL